MSLIKVQNKLRRLCEKAGSIRKWADENDEHFTYIARLIRGEVKRPQERILKKIGLREKEADYEKIPDYRN